MSKINLIQREILSKGGGEFQNLCDDYLQRKYGFKKIIRLGTYRGSSKTTRGIPDTYVDEDGYILIMYGHDESNPYSKLKKDIENIYKYAIKTLPKKNIKKIICCHTSNNITIEQNEELKKIYSDVELDIIGIDELSYDLMNNYQILIKEHLSLELDTGQILSKEGFVKKYDSSSLNAPLSVNYVNRQEYDDILSLLNNKNILVITGLPGVGKTKISLEICSNFCEINKDYECLYIKSNGLYIYDDLNCYIEKDKNYVIYIDDINELKELNLLIDMVNLNKDNSKIKIIASVRNYLLDTVINILKRYDKPYIYTLGEMEEKAIIKILEDEYSIKNKKYQEKILQISNGNPRIAIMAANGIVSGKLKSLNNVLEIYDVYYRDILLKKELDDFDLKNLFILALFLTIDIGSEKQLNSILELFNLEKDKFIISLKNIHRAEIIDLYQDRVAKISDQNFRNYILYYYLIVEKKIAVAWLLDLLYPQKLDKFLECINTIMRLFYSKDAENYITNQIKEIWSKEEYKNDFDFMTHFFDLDRLKSLNIIKSQIEQVESINYIVKNDDIVKKKNYVSIDDKMVEVLCGFKYGEYFDEALELLLLYFEKRPDLVINFYFAFTLHYGIDEYSFENDYAQEIKCVNKLLDFYKKASNKSNLTILIINIIINYLKYEHHITRNSMRKNTLEMLRVVIMPSDGAFAYRESLFKFLLYICDSDDSYCNFILKILNSYSLYPVDSDTKLLFVADLKVLCDNFFENWINPNILQSKILEFFYIMCESSDITIPECLNNYNKNTKYSVVRILEYGVMRNNNWSENDSKRQDMVLDFVENYKLYDYKNLFSITTELEKYDDFFDSWKIRNSIQDIFFSLKDNNLLLDVFEIYYVSNAPYVIIPRNIISLLLSRYDNDQIYNVLLKNDSEKVSCYINSYFLELTSVTEVETKRLYEFVEKELGKKNSFIPCLDDMIKFENVSKGIVEKIVVMVLEKANNISGLFAVVYDSDESICQDIIKCFTDIEVLEDAYLNSVLSQIDNDGYFGLCLLCNNKEFMKKIVPLMKTTNSNSSEIKKIFKLIWELDNFDDYISLAIDEAKKTGVKLYEISTIFFEHSEDEKDIYKRKKDWLEKYIEDNVTEIDKVIFAFEIINEYFKKEKKYFILKFLEINKNVEEFKKIPLNSYFSSWSGSEVPLIDARINYLLELKTSISGIDYLEHKQIIDEKIKAEEQYKESIKICEYIENANNF